MAQPLRRRQWIGASLVLGVVAIAALASWWPFDASPAPVESYEDPTVWQLIFSDRVALGFARLIIVGLALYIATSTLALAIAGRWLKGFGTTGLTADDAEDASESIEELEGQIDAMTKRLGEATEQIDTLTEERNQARALAVELYSKLTEEKGGESK